MADAIVYATARDQAAEVVTGDADLKDLPGVVYVRSPFSAAACSNRSSSEAAAS
ncbi:MAG: hypothetical protein LZF60_20137 [Nitrospira sp.]|nr:hypothetical protein [Nitrospira sp.]ULA58088.1 MAG: hypothetical protein LZF60_20137 [Nitrospira sp.]